MQNLIGQTIAGLDELRQLLSMIRGGELPVSILGVAPRKPKSPFCGCWRGRPAGRSCGLARPPKKPHAAQRAGFFFRPGTLSFAPSRREAGKVRFARIEALFSKGADVIHMPVLALQQKMMPPKPFTARHSALPRTRDIRWGRFWAGFCKWDMSGWRRYMKRPVRPPRRDCGHLFALLQRAPAPDFF